MSESKIFSIQRETSSDVEKPLEAPPWSTIGLGTHIHRSSKVEPLSLCPPFLLSFADLIQIPPTITY